MIPESLHSLFFPSRDPQGEEGAKDDLADAASVLLASSSCDSGGGDDVGDGAVGIAAVFLILVCVFSAVLCTLVRRRGMQSFLNLEATSR